MLVSRYECLEEIGEGGTSRVYRAYDHNMKREVALKRFSSDREPEEIGYDHNQEAEILSRLSHPNLINVHATGHDRHGHFIIMNKVEGTDLRQAFKGSMLNFDHFKSLAIQCLDGLAAIHSAGVLHLDIKPGNIMISHAGGKRLHAQIIDFGSARIMEDGEVNAVSEDGNSTHGTIYFMSPEQFYKQPLDMRADIYAMGCMFYELLTGFHAFNGETKKDVMQAHLNGDFEPLENIRPDLPPELLDLIHSMMASDRDKRLAHASHIASEIEHIENNASKNAHAAA